MHAHAPGESGDSTHAYTTYRLGSASAPATAAVAIVPPSGDRTVSSQGFIET
jgi:hypothetical protein